MSLCRTPICYGDRWHYVTAKGVEGIVPKTEATGKEFQLRSHARRGNEPSFDPRPSRRSAGKKAADASELSPEEIEAKITADPAMWASPVAKLREVAMESVAAIDKKSLKP
jgi:hypothetical protein